MNNKDYLPLLGLLAIGGIVVTSCEEDEEKILPPVFKNAHYFSDHSVSTLELPCVYDCITWAHVDVSQADLEIDADLPEIPDKLFVYRITRPDVDEDYAVKMARRFDFNGKPEEISNHTFPKNGFRFREEGKTLRIYQDGGIAVFYGTDPSRPSNLPSDEECIEIAQEWLEDHGLYPNNVFSIPISQNMITVVKDSAEGIQIIDIYSQNTSVCFNIGIDGYEVLGMGAYVSVGEDGEILAAYINTPQFKKYSTVSLRRLDAAIETFGDYLDYPQQFYDDTPKCLVDRFSSNMNVTEISIKYFCMLSEENALPTFAQPIYVFEGLAYREDESHSSSFTGRVDAVIR